MEQYLKRIVAKNILSFGNEGVDLELHPLNVFIGTNGSGKSNLIEIINLLRSLPSDFATYIRTSGGIGDVLWRGSKDNMALIDVTLSPLHRDYTSLIPIHHKLTFGSSGLSYEITDEIIENTEKTTSSFDDVQYFYRFNNGNPVLSSFERDDDDNSIREQMWTKKRKLRFFNKDEGLDIRQSILSQRKDPAFYPELSYLNSIYNDIKIYKEWSFGNSSLLRKPQKTDLPEDFLLETGENIGLVLNDIEHQIRGRAKIQECMKKLFEDYEDYSVKIHAGTIQVCLKEKGLLSPVPANRLSDGTLRYLNLLAILCHPKPPKVVCIEEPELGLHPDMIGQIAQLVIEASERTQLFITTHSDIFIDALSGHSESVFIVDKENGETKIHQEKPEQIAKWIENYSLGQLWRKGEIGGNRW
ncbi:MAG: AAA family ATPase [Candidatus Cloacimonetes bacterium]|nr:AAA family ATPase [Candidatus Cloacimonadota bacterium]